MLEHRRGLCTTIAPVRMYTHAHIIPPDTRSEEGATLRHDGADLTHRHQAPALPLSAPALAPGRTQISGDPA